MTEGVAHRFDNPELIAVADEFLVEREERGVPDRLLRLLQQLPRLQLCKFHNLVLGQELHRQYCS